jgi:hypothetical protein
VFQNKASQNKKNSAKTKKNGGNKRKQKHKQKDALTSNHITATTASTDKETGGENDCCTQKTRSDVMLQNDKNKDNHSNAKSSAKKRRKIQ